MLSTVIGLLKTRTEEVVMKDKKRFTIIEGGKINRANHYDDIDKEEKRLKELGSGLMDNILDIVEEQCSVELKGKIICQIEQMAQKDWGKVEVGKDFIGSIIDVIRTNCSRKQSKEIIDEILSRPNPYL
jgi:hypothetical protein